MNGTAWMCPIRTALRAALPVLALAALSSVSAAADPKGAEAKAAPAELEPFGPSAQAPAKPAPLALSVTAALQDNVCADKRWEYGQRDAGTFDTRPKLAVARGAFNGQDALVMDVWYPNCSHEFVDYHLPDPEKCAAWTKAGCEYLAFWCKADDTEGWMDLHLNRGNWRWMNGQPTWGTSFQVKPGPWRRVTLPFEAFPNLNPSTLAGLNTISLGYSNNRLQRPGKVLFAGFEAGAFDTSPAAAPVRLDTQPWRFQKDNKAREGVGLAEGWHKPDFDDSGWRTMRVGKTWDEQGLSYLGIAWFRQKAMIPAAWEGCPLVLDLGQPDDCGAIFLNGEKVFELTTYGPVFHTVVSPDKIKYGQLNTLAVRIPNWYMSGGIYGSPFQIKPQALRVTLRGADGRESPPAEFEMGAKPGKRVEVVLRFPRLLFPQAGLKAEYRITSCFHRVIKEGVLELKAENAKDFAGVIALDPAEGRELYYSEKFLLDCLLTGGGGPLAAFAEHQLQMKYEERDQMALPPLPETWEETPYGKLRLVDAVECAADDMKDEQHPYKEGGIRDSWVGLRAYSTWVKGIVINEYKGKRYRECNNNEWFGYRVGRGKLTPHTAYLVRIEYPEDKTRYCPLNQDAGRNYSGKGFKTGVSPNDPVDNYPLSGDYEWYDQLVLLDDKGYGYKGSRTAPGENGIWLFFHDDGRCYHSQYEAGSAASRIRVYEVQDIQKSCPKITYPEGHGLRVLMMDWEHEPEAPPLDVARYARFLGFNAIAPEVLKWGGCSYWPSKLGFRQEDPCVPFQGLPPGKKLNTYEEFLKAAQAAGIAIMPRLEYGGSGKLPQEAYAKKPDGGNAPVGRYASWGANLLHPATWDEFSALLDETVGAYHAQYPQLIGVLWRMRCDRVIMSQGPKDIALFKKETGATDLAGYEAWWHKKRLEFHLKIRDKLRSYRPDMKLYYYNWDGDGWSLGDYFNSARDWTDFYDVHKARSYYERTQAARLRWKPEDYLNMLKRGHGHNRPLMELYRDVDGIAFFAPIHWRYLADNEPYINYFRTGDGLAMCNMFNYEEKGRNNVHNDAYETSEMTPGGPAFAMAEEVLASFHGDPNVITCTTYTCGRGFINSHRRFAQAFLALPSLRGTVVPDALVAPDPDVRVRTYTAPRGLYVGVVSRAVLAKELTLRIPGKWTPAPKVTDLVTGAALPAECVEDRVQFLIHSGPMELNSFLVE
ncbi:MAG: hypothetical protein ABSE73_09075 [Planctomycetota bacterium]